MDVYSCVRDGWFHSTFFLIYFCNIVLLILCCLSVISLLVFTFQFCIGFILQEAPTLARAAYLLELAYFVHRCNNDDWPAMFHVSQRHSLKGYGLANNNAINSMKYQTGVLFHRWGVALGTKIDELINDEGERCASDEDDISINLLYQGKKKVNRVICLSTFNS